MIARSAAFPSGTGRATGRRWPRPRDRPLPGRFSLAAGRPFRPLPERVEGSLPLDFHPHDSAKSHNGLSAVRAAVDRAELHRCQRLRRGPGLDNRRETTGIERRRIVVARRFDIMSKQRVQPDESVSNTRAVRQSSRVVAGGQPLPSGPSIAPCTFARPRPGCSVAPTSSHAQAPPHRGPPHAVALRLRYLLASPGATPCALVLVTEHLEA